ncbi:Riboflavin biosynthesis protein ribd [Thalictrum thalictroides]|uniref:Riboflavin biosynthesis protein PYRD, chloroplastic n=1 Tax=Thalictrum thalictroides TaxID=46969 RepID=A0A7J6VE04_THATH|nr:Riboflavin biosynthesis protein ribd [Thalictrum thalictroides]
MNLQALCSSTLQVQLANPNKLSPPYHFFTPSVQTYPYEKSISNTKTQIGFCNLRKRVSESIIVMRNHGDSIGIKCEAVVDKDDGFYMRRCVEIAKKAIGCTSPNPMVGCVIVKDGVVVGEGFHPKAGQPHAEVFALRDAGDLAANATAYVSLEPCNHYGRTPPCTEALISAKVKRVVVGMVDPNPIVASKGVEKLRDSGIDVTVGVEEELCKMLNEAYIHRMLTGKPFVTLRYSLSVNGQLSDQIGEGAKVAGGYYSQLLQEYDGIIYSSTSITGKSIPTSQESHVKQPLQIIIAKSPNSPVQPPHFSTDAASQVIVFAEKDIGTDPEIVQQGIETVILEKLQLNAILDHCAQRGLCSVLIDLQGSFGDLKELLEEGVDNGLLQKVVMELLPFWDEGKESLTLKNLEKRVLRLDKLLPKTSGESVVVYGYL